MAKKCVHKGCGQNYDDDAEPCVYHPGPPEFHEGQKGTHCPAPHQSHHITLTPPTTQAGNAASPAS